MKKPNLDNFFRKDLNLENKWWHRLLSMLFFFLFIAAFAFSVISYSVDDIFRGGHVNSWKKVDGLPERITSEIRPIGSLVKPDEKIGEKNRTYTLNTEADDYYKLTLNNVYCSTELSSSYEKIAKDKNIGELYISSVNPFLDLIPVETDNPFVGLPERKKVSSEIFSSYIKQNGIMCMVVDSYTGQDYLNISFLEPVKSYQEDWSFYKKSSIKTFVYFIEMVPVVLAFSLLFFTGILVFYYKIIIYVIFGKKKVII